MPMCKVDKEQDIISGDVNILNKSDILYKYIHIFLNTGLFGSRDSQSVSNTIISEILILLMTSCSMKLSKH